MKIKSPYHLYILIFLTFFYNCQFDKTNSKQEFYVESFATHLDSTNISLNTLKESFTYRTELLKNRHSQNEIDSIFTFYTEKDTLSVYKTNSKEFFYSAFCKTTEFSVLKNISIGTNKTKLTEIFQIDIKNDTINISDLEKSFEATIIFDQDIIKQISYQNKYLD